MAIPCTGERITVVNLGKQHHVGEPGSEPVSKGCADCAATLDTLAYTQPARPAQTAPQRPAESTRWKPEPSP